MLKIFTLVLITILVSSCISEKNITIDNFSKKKDCYDSMLEYRKYILPDSNFEVGDYKASEQIEDWFYSNSNNTCYIDLYTRLNESGEIINIHALFDLYNSKNYHAMNSRNISGEQYSKDYQSYNTFIYELKNEY